MTRPGTSGAAPGPAGPGGPEPAAAGQPPGGAVPGPPGGGDLAAGIRGSDTVGASSGRSDARTGPGSGRGGHPGAPGRPAGRLLEAAGATARRADGSDDGIVTAGDRHPGHEHPLSSFAADPRMPIWIRRAVLAAAAGIVVAIFLDWRAGLTAAAIVAILDTIHRSRTTAVIPAAVRVTSAQRRTRRRLLLARRSGYLTLNGRAIPGTNCIIDHLIVGPGRGVRGGLRAVGPPAAAPGHPGRPPVPRPVQPDQPPEARPAGSGHGRPADQRDPGPQAADPPGHGDLRPHGAVDRGPDRRRGRVQRPAAPQVPAGPGAGPARAAADPRGDRAHPRRRRAPCRPAEAGGAARRPSANVVHPAPPAAHNAPRSWSARLPGAPGRAAPPVR